MGNTTSENTINESLQEIVNQESDTYQNSYLSCTSNNDININNCVVKDLEINQDGSCFTNQNFNANSSSQQMNDQNIDSQIQQVAEAVSQNLSLNPGSTTASNITNLSMNAVTNIKNHVSQGCSTIGLQGNRFNCLHSEIGGGVVNQKQSNNETSNCQVSSQKVQQASQKLTSTVSQKSKAIQKDAIFWTLIGTAILVLSFGVTAWLAEGALAEIMGWLALIIIVIAILGMIGTFFVNKKRSKEIRITKDDICADCSKYTKEECEPPSPDKNRVDAYCYWDEDRNMCACNDKITGVSCLNQCYHFNNSDECITNYCMWDEGAKKCTGGLNSDGETTCQYYVMKRNPNIPLS